MSLPPLVEPADGLTVDEVRRYSRHLIIPDVGMAGQKRLKNAKVLCVGAGGLGSPALMYLAAAGVGTLGVIEQLESQLRLREEEAREFRTWESTMLSLGTPEAIAAVAGPDGREVLHHDHRVEQRTRPGDPRELGQADLLHVEHVGLLLLQPGEYLAHRLVGPPR